MHHAPPKRRSIRRGRCQRERALARLGQSRPKPRRRTPAMKNQRCVRRSASAVAECARAIPASNGNTLQKAHARTRPWSLGAPGRNPAANGNTVASPNASNAAGRRRTATPQRPWPPPGKAAGAAGRHTGACSTAGPAGGRTPHDQSTQQPPTTNDREKPIRHHARTEHFSKST